METREAGKTKAKSIFALDSDEETLTEGDSGLADSFDKNSFNLSQADKKGSTETDDPTCDPHLLGKQDGDNQVSEEEPLNVIGSSAESLSQEPKITAFQKARIERNRQKALLLRQARLQAHPYRNAENEEHSVIRVQNSRLIDSGGGFLIDEKDLEEEQSKEVVITETPAPILLPERPHCDECQHPIHDSFLYRSFGFPICDTCRDEEDKHALVTRTEARQEYLLKDCDLDLREPVLRFILRKNPHNPRWGDMKLYLRSQIEQRALEVWETMEKLEEEKELRIVKREKSKTKKFNQQVKNLRMAVRSSVYKKQTTSHQHVYGAEQFDSEKDVYFRVCSTCSHQQEYEKM